MVLSVFKPANDSNNWFNPKNALSGWVSGTAVSSDGNFYTSQMIPVTGGDVLCFGAAVTGQGWHMVTYDAQKAPLRDVSVNTGLVVIETLDDVTSIMTYCVEDGVNYVRMVCDKRYLNHYLVTKNRIISAPEYRAWICPASMQAPTVRHVRQELDCWSVLLNRKGNGVITVGERSYVYQPGTVVCVPPHTPFSMAAAEGLEELYIHADSFFPGQQDGPRTIQTEDDPGRTIGVLMARMADVYQENGAGSSQLLEQLYETVQHLIRHQLGVQPAYDPQTARLIRFMSESFPNAGLRMEQVFACGDYCPNHLRRLFKKATGCSPLEFLNNVRIDHAKMLLEQNRYFGYSVTQVAQRCGFDDICYFSRLFKQKVGMPPTQYMNIFSAAAEDH